jgi:hypothetical protein
MNTEHETCQDCGTTDNLNDCGDSGVICDDCGADRYDHLMTVD